MVKLKGPCLSSEARGQLANTIDYRKLSGTATARKKPHPKNPKTSAQESTRAMFRFLTQQWPSLTPSEEATWADIIPDDVRTPYLNYLKYNLNRWARFAFPTKTYPATEDGTLSSIYRIHVVSGNGHVELLLKVRITLEDTWGIVVTRETFTPYTRARNNCIAFYEFQAATNRSEVDHPKRPGTYYYWGLGFTTKGNYKNSYTPVQIATVQ